MSRHYPCYWSNSRDCTKGLFEDTKDAFIIGSCDQNREEYIEEIKNIIEEVGLNPIFAEDLKENTNLDAFCDNICSHIRGSRIIINDISAPLKDICKICETSDYVPSLNVYWEYGYAAGLGKPQIVICDEEQLDKIPFDVAGKQVLKYTRATLKNILKPLIENELKQPIPESRFQVIIAKKIGKALFESYRENPSGMFSGEKYYNHFNNDIIPEEEISKNDFIIALEYLEGHRCVKLDRVMSSNMPFSIKVLPRIIDFIEE